MREDSGIRQRLPHVVDISHSWCAGDDEIKRWCEDRIPDRIGPRGGISMMWDRRLVGDGQTCRYYFKSEDTAVEFMLTWK